MEGTGERWSVGQTARIDAHVHSNASSGPVVPALGLVGCPECLSEPEAVYDFARSRGMDLVTLTDHDTIEGAQRLVDRGFERVIVGEEVTVRFPEDGCVLHVLVWGLTPDQHEQLGIARLREDVYDFAAWLRSERLAHAMAHPLYAQNGRLTRWHLERCALLFQNFELINGAHTGRTGSVVEGFVQSLTRERIGAYAKAHGMDPVWPAERRRGLTGGSDDHGLLNVGRAWTQVEMPSGRPVDPAAFLSAVRDGQCEAGGLAGDSTLLAHQIVSVAARWAAPRLEGKGSSGARLMTSRLLALAGATTKAPTRAEVYTKTILRRIRRAPSRCLPIAHALVDHLPRALARHTEISSRLSPRAWPEGPALGEHEAMGRFVEDATAWAGGDLADGLSKAIQGCDLKGIVEHAASLGLLHAAHVPYAVAMFHHHKDRWLIEGVRRATGQQPKARADAPRVVVFTDTLTEVNGVARFVGDVAAWAERTGRELHVVTCTDQPLDDRPNVHNVKPSAMMGVPGYRGLEVGLPVPRELLRVAEELEPDVIHVSTPGPVGLLGVAAANVLSTPLVGVYHTDFPAYADRLLGDPTISKFVRTSMRWLYERFDLVLARSTAYADVVASLGVGRNRISVLRPGVDIRAWSPSKKKPGLWTRIGVAEADVRVLSVGRISVEKGLPVLARAWPRVEERCRAWGVRPQLVVVGDGPYRAQMERELADFNVEFLGFQRGESLATTYASSDLFVMPSRTDTLGQVVLEAQASALPAIVSDEGGPKDIIVPGRTGLVAPGEEPRDWAAAIAGLCLDEERREEMGAAARLHAEGMSIERSLDSYWSLHQLVWRTHLDRHGLLDDDSTRPSRPGMPFRPGAWEEDSAGAHA